MSWRGVSLRTRARACTCVSCDRLNAARGHGIRGTVLTVSDAAVPSSLPAAQQQKMCLAIRQPRRNTRPVPLLSRPVEQLML